MTPVIYQAKKNKDKSKHSKDISRRELKRTLGQLGIASANSPLAAFIPLPKKVKFETQDKEEKVILLLRRHWFTNVPWIAIVLLAFLVPFSLTRIPLLEFLPVRFQLMTVIIWYLMILGFIFDRFLSWYFNVFIITDERVIDVDFFSLVYREISQAKTDSIQDVTYKSGGLFRTIFDYGDVFIQTAAEKLTVEFESVPQPAQVVKILNQLILEEEQEKVEGRTR